MSRFLRLAILLGALVGAQQPALLGQAVPAKLATVLNDLARAVPQDTGGLSPFQPRNPIAMTAMPRSVQDAARSRRLRLAGGNTVQVYILLSEVTTQTIGQLTAAGVTVEIANAGERRVQARVPVRSLRRIAGLPFVRFVRLPSYPIRHAGAVLSEGDAIHSANTARPQFGVDGTGVRVGVISDGINGVFATKCTSCDGVSGGPIGSDDLPEASGTRENGVLTGSTGGLVAQSFRSDADLEDRHSFFQPCAFRGAGAEGGALLEIVHDLAPGAQLSFGNADTSLSFIEAVNALAADNDVVVDDLGFLGEPADGQSSVSRNTAAALNNPANRIRTYVTSVGNAANDHYFGPYVASGVDGRSINGITTPGRLHLFQRTGETTDVLNLGDRPHDLISLPNNGEVVVVMTWNDPAGQSANNYDLYLVDDDTGEVVARSTDVQRGVQDALEAVDFLNRGEAGFFRIVVQNVNDEAAPRNLNMFAFQPQCAVDGPRRLVTGRHERHNYNTPTRSVLAQSDSGGSPVSAISVGAICSASPSAAAVFAGSDAPSESCHDINHSTIQFFSSLGPTLDGRVKPDVSAIDGVAITGAGRFPSPFFGTSAAAPHVAGIAALVLHAAPCLLSGGSVETVAARTAVRDALLTTADPLGGNVPNTTFGFGLANAFRAIETARGICPAGTPQPPPTQPGPTPPPAGNQINVNATITYQTMSGWEGAVLASVEDYIPLSDAQLAAIFDLAVNDLGLTRARLEVHSGAENRTDWQGQWLSGAITKQQANQHRYEIENDNGDANSINPSGFHFSALDYQIDRLIRPLRARVMARGETPYVSLLYVDFGDSSFEHYANPAEYAEFMLAMFQHMRTKYGFVPDAIDVINEPNDVNGWSGTNIGRAIVATAAKLQSAGFAVPQFIAPSVSGMSAAPGYVDQIMAVPGAAALVTEFSYHRYSSDMASLQAVAARAVQHGKRTSMLEYWDSNNNYPVLHQDLAVGRNSAWQQGPFADAYHGAYNWVVLVNGAAQPSANAKFLRQYTKYVRPGARRIDALSGNGALEPLAFVNTTGRHVVVVKTGTDESFTVNGLPAGTYGIFYTTNSAYDVQLPDVSISSGQGVTTRMPATGVLTIYGK